MNVLKKQDLNQVKGGRHLYSVSGNGGVFSPISCLTHEAPAPAEEPVRTTIKF